MDTAAMEKAMKAYKPRRPKTTIDDVIYSDDKKRMLQDAKDEKDRQAIKDMGYAKGGSVGSASKRADGCAQRGKTKGKMV
jgi:hypothetical protein